MPALSPPPPEGAGAGVDSVGVCGPTQHEGDVRQPPTLRLIPEATQEVGVDVLGIDTARGAQRYIDSAIYDRMIPPLLERMKHEDGEDAEVLRANVLFRAVEVSEGRHVVEFRFEPLRGLWRRLTQR